MSTLVECVPNFSEGRDRQKISQITAAIEAVAGITLLDVDPGADTNRTVVTFVGSPDAVEEAAFRVIKTAAEVLDMRHHHGAHARQGATDVCPFIPVSGVSIEDCVELSKRVGKRVGDSLGIPVYLYEYSAQTPERVNLAAIRAGEYEGLAEKLKDPRWKPDFGPAKFHAGAGATVLGCREFLIAYNLNLNTRDKRIATDIAFELREKGRSLRRRNSASPNLLDGDIVRYGRDRYPCAFCDFKGTTTREIVTHNQQAHDFNLEANWLEYDYVPDRLEGKPVKKPGLFRHVKAVGWYLDTYKRAQISINFTNYKESPVHAVFDAACDLARDRGVRVTGSELVGLIPLEAVLMAGRHYLRKQRRSTGVPEEEVVETAIQSLGLNDVVEFRPAEKIIDYAVSGPPRDLANRTVLGFLNELSTSSPAPGGGSVSALAGSLGAALASMVAALTHEKPGFEPVSADMETWGVEAQGLKDRLAVLMDEDTQAFNQVLAAGRLGAATEEEKTRRQEALRAAGRYAIEIPAEVCRLSLRVMELARLLIRDGNPNSVSDAGVAAEIAAAAVNGAGLNVLINLPTLEGDDQFVKRLRTQILEHMQQAGRLRVELLDRTQEVIIRP